MFLNLKVVVSDKLNISVPVFILSASDFFFIKIQDDLSNLYLWASEYTVVI